MPLTKNNKTALLTMSVKLLTFELLKTKGIMNTEANFEAFWALMIKHLHDSNPNPVYVSGYKARKDYHITPQAIQKGVEDSVIRTQATTTKGKAETSFADSDVKMYKTLKDAFADAKSKGFIQEKQVFGVNKVLAYDTFSYAKSLTKHETEIFYKMISGFSKIVLDIDLDEKIKEKLKK